MVIAFQIVFALSCVFALSYFVMTTAFLYGWMKIPETDEINNDKNDTSITIVVATRNEENNIAQCLNNLAKQDYPSALFEIIIVDDNSEDNTVLISEDCINQLKTSNIRLIELSDYNKISKKEAIKCGVENASGSLILTTDADCCVGESWAKNIVTLYEKKKYKLICGPVTYERKEGLFQQFQLLDFLSMIISGAGAVGIYKSFIGNAANMAFEKKAFLEVNNSNYDSVYASGDDVFLMHKIKEKDKKNIGFIKSTKAIVTTKPQNNLKQLILQRVRWASKSKGYKDLHALTFTLNILLFNFLIVFLLFAGCISAGYFYLFLTILTFKIIVDFPLIYNICNFNNRKDLLLHYLWIQMVYPFYIVCSAMLTVLKKDYLWKGRRYS